MANYERAFSKILDVFDITVETYNSDTNISKYLAKVKEIKELEENGFKPNNPILIKKKKERGILISNAGYSLNKNNILLTSSFTYIYSIFESYNNILLDIFEDIDGNDSLLRDKLHKLCKINPNGYIENSVYQEVFIKGDKKAASKLKLFPNLFYELNGLFQADKYFKDEGQLEKYKMLIDFHSEIKIRRNILTHDSLEFLKNDNKLVSNYLSRFNDKKSVSDKKRIKSLLKFLFGNKHANLNEKDLEIDIAYINHVVCVLLELMTIFFASVFSGFQVELKNKPKRDKINCIDESRLFSEVINRLNCSFDSFLVKGKGVSSLDFLDFIQ